MPSPLPDRRSTAFHHRAPPRERRDPVPGTARRPAIAVDPRFPLPARGRIDILAIDPRLRELRVIELETATPAFRALALDGFGPAPAGEDPFDATVGALTLAYARRA